MPSELYAHEAWRVVPDLRWRPCCSSRFVALAKLEPVNPVNAPCGGERLPYAFANISVRKHSPVFIIAQRIRASLFASATVTSRAGFFASSPTIQSRKAPLRLPRTLSSEVAPKTSIFLIPNLKERDSVAVPESATI